MMVEKMIFRLMDEQKDEDVHKLWCDKEIAKSNEMKDDKDDKLKELRASIKVETAAVAKLTEDIKNANKMISGIASFMKEATEIRNVGTKENKWAMKDAQDAQKAVANAEAVMESFYKESGAIKKKPWEFIQEEIPQKLNKDPKLWDAPYNGVSDPKNQPGASSQFYRTLLLNSPKWRQRPEHRSRLTRRRTTRPCRQTRLRTLAAPRSLR